MDPELYNAVIDGSESFFEKIRGLDLNLQFTSQGNSLLHVAAKSGKKQIVEEILNNSQPSLMYKKNFEGNTPLHIAASLGHLEMTELLIKRAKIQEVEELEVQNKLLWMENIEKDTALHGAVRNGHHKIVDILIQEDRDLVLSTNSDGESPLFLAVDRGFYQIAFHMQKIIPKCSYEGRNKMNILHAAAIRTPNAEKGKSRFYLFVDFVRELLNNCTPSALLEKDNFGWIPLHHAAHAGNAEVVELFLENNHQLACIITENEGMSALHISAKEGHVDVMRTLITKCPEICELLDSRGRTALHVAVENGMSGAVKVLLETVAFHDLINKKDKEGNTPLHLAAVKGSFWVLARFAWNRKKVEKGATNEKGMTAIDTVSSNINMVSDIMLKMMGCLPSLQQGVTREATEANRIDGQSQQTETKDEAKTTHQENAKEIEYQRKKDFNLLIVTIIATVTFAAGVALPGGYSMSIDSLQTLSRNSTSSLRVFVMFNSLAFGCSSGSMLLHFLLSLLPQSASRVSGFGIFYKIFLEFLTECAILFMILAFLNGTSVVFPWDSGFGQSLYRSTFYTTFFPEFLLAATTSVVLAVIILVFARNILKKVFKKK